MTSEIMTMSEIEKQYNREWVLLEDPVVDNCQQVLSGKLLFHSSVREEVVQVAKRLGLKNGAFLFTGPMPDHIAINL